MGEGKTPADILAMVEGVDNDGQYPFRWEDVEIAEQYEWYEPSSLAEAIDDMRGVKVYEFMQVLTRVNGEEWATNYKKEIEVLSHGDTVTYYY